LFFLSDGTSVIPLTPAQDFKRAYDNDEGPNTGGMGAYSPLPWLPEGFVEEVEEKVALPTVNEMARLGAPFIGLLYCGLIITKRGIRVIEFNARFGDPETQVVLRRLNSSLSNLLYKAASGHLEGVSDPEFSKDVAITVVLASEGYPDTSAPNRPIYGIGDAEREGVEVCHAATAWQAAKEDGEEALVATGISPQTQRFPFFYFLPRLVSLLLQLLRPLGWNNMVSTRDVICLWCWSITHFGWSSSKIPFALSYSAGSFPR
ncbi:MAG: phosphoribosylamine--glycine ligase, partial [Sediminibacterium sp.]